MIHRKSSYGHHSTLGYRDTNDEAAGRKKVIVEVSSPNIAKVFHAAHLRSTMIGVYIANLHKSMGWEVINMKYLGDWVKQLGLVALGRRELDPKTSSKVILSKIYVRIDKPFRIEKAAIQAAKDRKEDTSQLESQGVHGERNNFVPSACS